MQVVKEKDGYVATLTAADAALIDRVIDPLLPFAKFDRLGQYRRMTAQDFWRKLVGQVCVMGGARHWEKATTSMETMALLHYDAVRVKRDPTAYLANVLEEKGATRFHPNAARKLADALANRSFFAFGKLVAFDSLPHKHGPDAVRNALMGKWAGFGMKSASDFMITVGLSDDVLALDSRIVGFLNRHCQFGPKAGSLQSNPPRYRAVEHALRSYARSRGISLAKLDRTLFQFSVRSVVDFIAGTANLQMMPTAGQARPFVECAA